jgi:excisionase family DNA binding protein
MGKAKETKDVAVVYVDTKEAARLLGYTLQHTRLLIRTGQLKAIKFGRDWMIERKSITDFNAQKA